MSTLCISNPIQTMFLNKRTEMIEKAIELLPSESKTAPQEMLRSELQAVLRELDEMSYKQIAAVADLPLGTVMSRLARARKRLQQILSSPTQTEVLS